ncbi:protein of unknown function [Arthrobacter sp. cf158]|uniref:DUF4192 domain-containing protein n=1 Tax=Arthrobacter sp. cf158 TaxID=1761744 RepID=UPI00089AC8B5|nr:DUF4192 domain-containing protein [Arthrobacter sp. cf158]SDW83494.1 protein of unknown function [Arthrobacter sp. cf158]
MTTNRTLSIHQPEDILGYIPHMLGYWPEDSLVAITMQGNVLGATLRVDLPSDRSRRALAGFADLIRSYLIADEDANGVVLAVYTDAGWADGRVVGMSAPMLDALQLSLQEVGLPVRDAWLIGPEYWRGAYCSDENCCSAPGLPVERIRNSRLSAELVFRGSAIGPSPRSGLGNPLLARQGALDPLVLAAESRYSELLSGRWRSEACLDAVLAVWMHVMQGCSQSQPAQLAADAGLVGFLRYTMTVTSWRDAVVVMAAAGIESAKLGAGAFGLFVEDDEDGLPFDPDDFGLPFAGVTPPAETLGDSGGMGNVFGYGEVLLGMKPDKPSWGHLDALARILSRLCVVDEKGEVAAAALTLQGWISWCKGSGSIAHGCLSRAQLAFPGYRLAELLMEVMGQGAICGWARRSGSAWRGSEGANA